MDYTPVIIDALRVLEARDRAEKKPFSARAYATVLRALEAYAHPIRTREEIPAFQGVGEKIKKKMEEIVDTGRLETAEQAKAAYSFDALACFESIYGVGPVKARELVQRGLRTITDLRVELHLVPDLLHEKQKAGLAYYEDLIQRIPRDEMRAHEAFLQHHVVVPFTIVGSYRRGAETSGDVDVLLRVSNACTAEECGTYLDSLMKTLENNNYMEYVLAQGDHKAMGIARLPGNNVARRVDFLVVTECEYACSLLYFTGSDAFNVAFRQHALKRGYTLNEHALTPLNDAVHVPPSFEKEEDIFRFLSLQYVIPEKRNETTLRTLIKRPLVVHP